MRVLFAAWIVILLASCAQKTDMPEFPARPAPLVTGVDQNGQSFSSSVLHGKPWLASFFFTTCESVCPALNAVQKQLVTEFGGRVGFVSISTDPETDTGATLAAYAKQYEARPGSWWMMNMPEDKMREIATKGFSLMDPKEPAMHSTRFVAIDAEGMIRGYFDSSDSAGIEKLKTWIHSQL